MTVRALGAKHRIKNRIDQKIIGFGAAMNPNQPTKPCALLQQVQPEDLLNRRMIPEFVERLPVIAPLHELSEEALVEILTEPRKALVKQYKKLFEMDAVELTFTPGALRKVAELAQSQKSGARGPRQRGRRGRLRHSAP